MTESKPQIGGFAGWALSAWQRGRDGAAARRKARSLELLETLPMGGRRQIAVVSCDGRRFLIGMSADSVTSMLALDKAEASQSDFTRTTVSKTRWEGGL